MESFSKVVHPGDRVFVRVEYGARDDGKDVLSITGVVNPTARDFEAAGQIVEHLDSIQALSPGWTPEMVERLKDVWEKWHLNDMRAGCEHQRADGWENRRIPAEELGGYYRKIPNLEEGVPAVRVFPEEHPDGLLGKPCPVCGYRYGTKWLHEWVPGEVLAFLKGLPEAENAPDMA